ncbi:hypothetical protein [Sulfuriflexus mobilis]|uniref:hypothetical protein n=1 Tax=Sulfuriflexus mobilis TaxID=1811807 RepID=UPI000F838B61|nr:hypothetical protein [Sulfuriflexus mobilis]
MKSNKGGQCSFIFVYLKGANNMKSLKVALWVTALGCLTAVPFIFLPWAILENLISWFGIEPLPNVPVVVYFVRVVCGVFGLIGIFFIILARNPLGYGPMLDLGAYGLILFGLLALMLGFTSGLPLMVYIGDALFGLILGIIISILSSKSKRARL